MYDGTSITAGEYFMIAYDTNGCCSSLEFAKTEPEENTLSIGDIDPILCPGGTTNIDFTIEGDIGQFDIFLNSVIYEQSVQGGTITVESTDADGDDLVHVGRIRKDLWSEKRINLWVVADNLLKGAALNSVQIAELIFD